MAQDSLVTLHQSLGWVHSGVERHAEAIASFRAVSKLQDQLLERHPRMGGLYFNAGLNQQWLGQVQREAGDLEAAINESRDLMPKLTERIQRFPELKFAFEQQQLECLTLLASTLEDDQQLEPALSESQRAIELAQRLMENKQQSHGLIGRVGAWYFQRSRLLLDHDSDASSALLVKAIDKLTQAVENGAGVDFEIELENAIQFRSLKQP